MPGPIIGLDCKLYYNSATYGTPTWVEVSEIGDLTLPDFTLSLAEIKTRSSVYVKHLAGLKTLSVEFDYLYGAASTVFNYLRTAFFDRTVEEFAIMDGPIATTGREGIRGPFFIESFPINQNLEEASMVQGVRLALSYLDQEGTSRDPEWYTVP